MKGGHPERFGVGVLLFDYLTSSLIYRSWTHLFPLQVAQDVLMLVVFILLAVRGVRWWPAVTVGALALIVTVHLLTVMAPIGRDAVLSARMGLWFLVYATLLAGVMERWLAGERPVSEARRWREGV
ncbi:MAG: hypothetical protein EON89_09645 [Brevundimonas sp.]|nr:MAG: hypothetical protein EON89_09645 [Brevundimonas sp.]